MMLLHWADTRIVELLEAVTKAEKKKEAPTTSSRSRLQVPLEGPAYVRPGQILAANCDPHAPPSASQSLGGDR